MSYCTLRTNSKLNFGKYLGEKVEDIIERDPKYLVWAIKNTKCHPSKEVIDMLEANGNKVELNPQAIKRNKNGRQPTERWY